MFHDESEPDFEIFPCDRRKISECVSDICRLDNYFLLVKIILKVKSRSIQLATLAEVRSKAIKKHSRYWDQDRTRKFKVFFRSWRHVWSIVDEWRHHSDPWTTAQCTLPPCWLQLRLRATDEAEKHPGSIRGEALLRTATEIACNFVNCTICSTFVTHKKWFNIKYLPFQRQQNLQVTRYDGILLVAPHRHYDSIRHDVWTQSWDIATLQIYQFS